MSSQLFNKLAEAQHPRTLGQLNDRTAFSRPVFHGDEPVNYARVPIKLGGTELVLPDYLQQFEEFAMRSLVDYTRKSAQHDYKQAKATLYFSQRRLDPGQFSLATNVHMDIDLESAVRGNMAHGQIYVASDVSDITTRVYTNPFDIDANSVKHLQGASLQEHFEAELTRQCTRNESFDPQAYELVNFADTQPHVARSLTDRSVDRTFVFIIFTQDQIVNHRLDNIRALEDMNEDLFFWMVEREMKRAQRNMEL